ncbi:MAG: hypothetical protein SVU32_06370, partial [Candidatus Nanohaloarchaea archaeon]|nr:hypothetical protein [Candidatus Nanohaloarchaea archaeon]
ANGTREHAYSYNVTANHTDPSEPLTRYHIRSAETQDSIVMADDTPPRINISLPVKVEEDTTVKAGFDMLEPGLLNLSRVNGTFVTPNGTFNFTPTLINQQLNEYRFQENLTRTGVKGDYQVNITACDITGNCRTVSDSFSIFGVSRIHGTARDLSDIENDQPPIHSTFEFRNPQTDEIIYNFTSDNQTGVYNRTIQDRTYQFDYTFFQSRLRQHRVVINRSYLNPVRVGDIATSRVSSSVVNAIYVESRFPYNDSTIFVNIPDDASIDVSNARIFRCSQWIVANGCNTSWNPVNTQPTQSGSKVFSSQINPENGEAYAVGPFFAGDGVCESDFGETFELSPNDCPQPVQGGGAGGGGGGGAGRRCWRRR